MICASTVDAEIKPSSALTESRGSWEPGRKRHGKWTAEGKVNGDKRPVSGPYACVKGRKCDGISAREDERAWCLFINKGGTARRFSRPVL